MLTVLKYLLEITDTQIVYIPKGAVFRSLMMQRGMLCAWFETEYHTVPAQYRIFVVGTGQDADRCKGAQFLGSVIDGMFVWHVYGEPV